MAKKADHSWNGAFVGYVYCLKCGLIALKNISTAKAIRKACPGDEGDDK